jgi:multiple sugar transport system permease protein
MASPSSDLVLKAPRLRLRGGKVVQIAILLFVFVLIMFPIYWMVLSIIQPYKYSLVYSPSLFIRGIDLSPFHMVFLNYDMGLWLWNSTQLALMVTGICLVLSLLGAYALSKLRWKAKPAFGFFILLTQMMPGAIIVVPVLRLYRSLHMTNSLPALAFVQAAFALPICIWILKNVFDSVPTEIMEAALTEGCGEMGVLWRVLLPLSVPGLVAVCVVAFFFSWNEYLFASTLVTPDSGLLPGSVGLTTMMGIYDTPIQLLLAAGLVFALPPVIFYILIQRYMISGLTAGAVKG